MEEKNTQVLMNILASTHPEELGAYGKTYLREVPGNFAAYMDGLIARKGLKRQDILQKADLPQKYGYKLLTGERHTSDRDKLLRIFFAMGLTLREAQRALELYGLPALYPKRMRDSVFIVAFNSRVDSVDTVNDWLREQELPELSRSGD